MSPVVWQGKQKRERRNKMKTSFLFTATLAFAMALTLTGCAEDPANDSGGDSPSVSSSSGTNTNTGNYTDKGNSISSYKTVKIGTQTWMAENLNYKVAGSKCYGEGNSKYSASEVQANCNKYGRLYDWATAMNLPAKCNEVLSTSNPDCAIQSKHKGICPSGWHIPSNEDWNKLSNFADSSSFSTGSFSTAGKYLKSTSGWDSGGNGDSGGDFSNVGSEGKWWEADEDSSWAACRECISGFGSCGYYSADKSSLLSVRCVQD
jgi:uncharacterized protein (TIGR02145 family)